MESKLEVNNLYCFFLKIWFMVEGGWMEVGGIGVFGRGVWFFVG